MKIVPYTDLKPDPALTRAMGSFASVPGLRRAKVEEAGDDHFYGAWKGGAASAGGGPVQDAKTAAADDPKMAHRIATAKELIGNRYETLVASVNGMETWRKKGDPDGVPIEGIREMGKLHSKDTFHNHPKGHPLVPSPDDIEVAAALYAPTASVAGYSAVTGKPTLLVMHKPEAGWPGDAREQYHNAAQDHIIRVMESSKGMWDAPDPIAWVNEKAYGAALREVLGRWGGSVEEVEL